MRENINPLQFRYLSFGVYRELPPGCFKVSPASPAGVISKAGGQHGSSAGGTTQVWKLEEKKKLDLLGKTLEINPAGVGCQRKSTKLLSVRIRVRRFVCLRSDFTKRHMSLKIQGVQKEDKVGHSGSDGLMKN